MPLHVKVGGGWKPIANMHVKSGGAWKPVTDGWVKEGGVWKRILESGLKFTLSAGENLDLFSVLGSPADPIQAEVIIPSGVIIGSSNSNPALVVSGFAAGSQITLVNHGSIQGSGGSGGPGSTSTSHNAGYPASVGCDAISINNDLIINNADGQIFGGGGGGGGGGRGSSYGAGHDDFYCGGTGGAGAGYGQSRSNGGQYPGSRGGHDAGDGGNGGDWGQAGVTGGGGFHPPQTNGGAGGAAGKAIKTNGHTVTWLAGNDATHVKGAVG